MSVYRINAIAKKQIKDSLKNKAIFIQFIMFPAMAFIMTISIKMDNLPHAYFVNMFASMYISMAPIVSMSSIIGEEKEKYSLRMLQMSNVKPMEYLIGIGSVVASLCLVGLVFMGVVANYQGTELIQFVLLGMVGVLISILVGALIGLISHNQMSASSLSVPAMLVLSFTPMISSFNTTFEKVGKYIYTQQFQVLMNSLPFETIPFNTILIISSNFILSLALFIYFYRKNGLAG